MLSIAVIIPNFNNAKGLTKCLASIRDQEYDHNKIEILIPDGGSTDGSIEIISKFKARLIKENTDSPESAKAIALRQTKFANILFLATDNILPTKDWLINITKPLLDNPKIIASYPWRYAYRKSDNSLNRYFALLGANDPIPYFLHKTDRQDHLSDNYALSGDVIKETDNYYTLEFNPNNMPTLGDNGFLIRRSVLEKAQIDPETFFHIDVIYDLVNQGYKQFGVVKNDIVHISGDNFLVFLRKRLHYMQILYLDQKIQRRYFVSDLKRDFLKLLLFSFYSQTLIGPLLFATKGFLKIPDLAWFWHIPICFCHFWVYAFAFINHWISLLAKLTNYSPCVQRESAKSRKV